MDVLDYSSTINWYLGYAGISMGHWESNHRKHGYAEIVLKAAVSDCCLTMVKVTQEENTFTSSISGVMISYIVDSNDASRSLYQKLGWKRVADADWVGFASRNKKIL